MSIARIENAQRGQGGTGIECAFPQHSFRKLLGTLDCQIVFRMTVPISGHFRILRCRDDFAIMDEHRAKRVVPFLAR